MRSKEQKGHTQLISAFFKGMKLQEVCWKSWATDAESLSKEAYNCSALAGFHKAPLKFRAG